MTSLKTVTFSGLLPRMSPSLLPETNATVAKNCDFAYGELRGIKDDFRFLTLSNSAASIYTDDGIVFYSWVTDVDAVRSPLASDTFDRLYYTTPDDFRVTTRSGMRVNGGEPGSSYRVGVPRPVLAPVLTVPSGEVPSTAEVTAMFHYEYSGIKYQEAVATLTTITPGKKWTFTAPVKTEKTPTQAFVVLKLTATDPATKETVLSVYSLNSSLARQDSLWTLTLNGDAATTEATPSNPNTPPTPAVPQFYTADLTINTSTANQQTTAYVFTYVNTYNEEGPPSPPASITGPLELGTIVQVTRNISAVGYAPIKEIRIYRTATGSSIVDYFYATSISVLTQAGTQFTVTDKTAAADLAEPLSSDNYYPPDPSLVGLIMLPNGIMCARKGNELHFSEAYKPWAWPPEYVQTYKHTLIGAIVHGSAALVTTTIGSFFISGVAPSQMSESETGAENGGLTKWSMAKVGALLVYASNDGIVVVSGGRATMQPSERFFTRDVWRALYRAGFSEMRFAVWDGRLIVYSPTKLFTAFMIRFDEAAGSMTELPNFVASCSFTSPLADQLYMVRQSFIYEFAGGPELPATWRSREVVTPSPINFGAAQVICSGVWDVLFYAQDDDLVYQLVHTESLTADAIFRLPDGFMADRWMVAVTGTGRMRELRVAQSMSELRRG